MLKYVLSDLISDLPLLPEGDYVYCFRNIETNKCYVGSTNNLNRRFYSGKQSHLQRLKTNDQLIHQWINFEGIDKFVIEFYPSNNLELDEESYIRKFDSCLNGYNQTSTGKSISTKGMTWITKDDRSISITNDLIDRALSEGWSYGKHYNITKGRISVILKKDNIIIDEKRIYPELLTEYLSKGYVKGSKSTPPSNKNTKVYNNGKINIQVTLADVQN